MEVEKLKLEIQKKKRILDSIEYYQFLAMPMTRSVQQLISSHN